ncbi:MAG: hypothetical protein M1127_01155 [Patescibacteria group bacterium]|nr:hypothetical protein [Patescibacteria group bacterium]
MEKNSNEKGKIVDFKTGEELIKPSARAEYPAALAKDLSGEIEGLKKRLLDEGAHFLLTVDTAFEVAKTMKAYIATLEKGEGLNVQEKLAVQETISQLEELKRIMDGFEKIASRIDKAVSLFDSVFGSRSRGK